MFDTRDYLIVKLKKFFHENHEEFKIQMAFVFGSFAHETDKESSDIDIAIVFSGKKDPWSRGENKTQRVIGRSC